MTESEKTIQVVIADDHAVVREGIRRILATSNLMEVVGVASDGNEAWHLIDEHRPNVAILDIRMPELTGIEILGRINEAGYKTRVLILTNYDDQEYVLDAMSQGASGYLMKSVAAGLGRLWGRRHERGSYQIGMDALTGREKETLALACRGMRNRMISDEMGISVRTVEGHFNSIYSKLGVTSRIEAVLQAVAVQS